MNRSIELNVREIGPEERGIYPIFIGNRAKICVSNCTETQRRLASQHNQQDAKLPALTGRWMRGRVSHEPAQPINGSRDISATLRIGDADLRDMPSASLHSINQRCRDVFVSPITWDEETSLRSVQRETQISRHEYIGEARNQQTPGRLTANTLKVCLVSQAVFALRMQTAFRQGWHGGMLIVDYRNRPDKPPLATMDTNCIINEALAVMREGHNVVFVSKPIDGRETRKVNSLPTVPCACCGEPVKFESSPLQSMGEEFRYMDPVPEVEYALC